VPKYFAFNPKTFRVPTRGRRPCPTPATHYNIYIYASEDSAQTHADAFVLLKMAPHCRTTASTRIQINVYVYIYIIYIYKNNIIYNYIIRFRVYTYRVGGRTSFRSPGAVCRPAGLFVEHALAPRTFVLNNIIIQYEEFIRNEIFEIRKPTALDDSLPQGRYELSVQTIFHCLKPTLNIVLHHLYTVSRKTVYFSNDSMHLDDFVHRG